MPLRKLVGSLLKGTLFSTFVVLLAACGGGGGGTGETAPANLVYSINPAHYGIGTAIPLNIPSNSGGAPSSYSVSPPLPTGLELDTTTGTISGTPAATSAATDYTVTATNGAGATQAVLNIAISAGGGGVAASITSFYPADYKLDEGAGGTTLTAEFVGTGTIDNGVGAVTSGTPVAVNPANPYTSYTLSVTGSNGTVTQSLTITRRKAADGLTPAPIMLQKRWDHTATLLTNGKVLVAGGQFLSGSLSSAELHDPATNSWSAATSLSEARYWHTATRLTNGKVLVVGGVNPTTGSYFASAELYDPATNSWSSAGSMATDRRFHTATLLANGKVLVVGGLSGSTLSSAELYDPAANSWSTVSSMAVARQNHSATRQADGKVMVVGGAGDTSVEIYDPVNNSWSTGVSLPANVGGNSSVLLPNGNTLVVAGFSAWELTPLPAPGVWQPSTLANSYPRNSLTVLANGNVAAAGGEWGSRINVYNPTTRTWSAGPVISNMRAYTSTLLPSGKVLLAGVHSDGYTGQLYDPVVTDTAVAMTSYPEVIAPAPYIERYRHTATLLANGKVLLAGGAGASESTNTQLFDPATVSWSDAGALAGAIDSHTATRLANGKVLVAGGATLSTSGATTTAAVNRSQLYDPSTNSWSTVSNLLYARRSHTATLLANGKVLVVGGRAAGSNLDPTLDSVELYDPATDSWTETGKLAAGRASHTATLLADGRVLVTGGVNSALGGAVTSAEIYDPAAGSWTTVTGLATARYGHVATLLSNGKVLVMGGRITSYLTSAELYDPANGNWSTAGDMSVAYTKPVATLLENGKVLVTGENATNLYDPASNTWATPGAVLMNRQGHTATLLSNGGVVLIGGATASENYVEWY